MKHTLYVLHTDLHKRELINVKMEKNTVRISSTHKQKEGQEDHEWKLNKRATLPEDCDLDTVDISCDKKKSVVKVSCCKIEGERREAVISYFPMN